VVEEAFYVQRNFAGQQELLAIELSGHFFLERFMKELAEDNDDGQHEEERQDKRHGGEQLFLAQRAEKALKHGLMYFQRRGNVKRLKPDL
jgi:hypothetical protein